MLPPTSFPMPLFRVAVHAKTKADLDKLSNSLSRLVEEDLTLQVFKDPDTAETIMAGIGESHVDVAIEKMKRKFGADVAAGLPRVSYKETITLSAKRNTSIRSRPAATANTVTCSLSCSHCHGQRRRVHRPRSGRFRAQELHPRGGEGRTVHGARGRAGPVPHGGY